MTTMLLYMGFGAFVLWVIQGILSDRKERQERYREIRAKWFREADAKALLEAQGDERYHTVWADERRLNELLDETEFRQKLDEARRQDYADAWWAAHEEDRERNSR